MKTLPPNAKLNVPDEQERRQIFYWLQKVTSLTAWRRILMRYQAWAIATENSLRVADETGLANTTSLSHSEYALVLKCLAHCEEGVLRLAQGDKRIFKFDANGEFVMAQRMLSHWTTMIDRIEIGETRVNPNTPLSEPFTEALDTLGRAWGECGPWILEGRFIEDPATIFYGEPLTSMWQTMWFPPALEPVPDPAENTFVRTGRPVPCSGIWEPIDANTARPTSMLSMFKRTPEPQAPFQIVGAMSFLHGASNAPPVTVETADDVFDIDTTWRLLWRDDRYKNGTIPPIEASYRFVEPQAERVTQDAEVRSDAVSWAESGEAVSVAGKWLVESDLTAAVTLQQGDQLPLHKGRDVRWVLAGK